MGGPAFLSYVSGSFMRSEKARFTSQTMRVAKMTMGEIAITGEESHPRELVPEWGNLRVLHSLMTGVKTNVTNANAPTLQELILASQDILVQEVH